MTSPQLQNSFNIWQSNKSTKITMHSLLVHLIKIGPLQIYFAVNMWSLMNWITSQQVNEFTRLIFSWKFVPWPVGTEGCLWCEGKCSHFLNHHRKSAQTAHLQFKCFCKQELTECWQGGEPIWKFPTTPKCKYEMAFYCWWYGWV